MKKFNLSLVVIAAMATASYADIKLESVGGSAKLFYDTNDASGDLDLFNKAASIGNVAANINGVATLGKCDCTKLNFGITGVSTMGLESTLVGGTWIEHMDGLSDAVWIDTLNVSFSPLDGISNTTMVVGRQALATPMVFTEKWNIAENTYDAAVAVNTDIIDTTLIAGWIGRSNVAGGSTVRAGNIGDGYQSFLTKEGAYAVGAITTAIPTVTAQAWYYVAPSVSNVAWAQAETEYAGFSLGGQFGMLDASDNSDGNVFAVKVGYSLGGLGLSASFSSVDNMTDTAAALGFANLGGSQSPLYTETWWSYGHVGAQDTDSFNVTATYALENIADLGIYYTSADHASDADMSEMAISATKSIGSLDATLVYYNTDVDDGSDASTGVQAYLVYNF